MTQNDQQATLNSSIKSDDTEEKLDMYFYRPLGFQFALLFQKLGITPNPVTIANIVIGVIAGCFFYPLDIKYNVIGMLLLMLANTLDSADGQLARMTNNKSRLGRILDGLSGNFWFTVITIAITLRLRVQGWDWWIWLLAVGSGISHQLQSQMADYYRNVHLYFIKGRGGSEQDNSKALNAELATLSWGKNFWKKMVLLFYRNYTKQQELLSPKMQLLLNDVRNRYNDVLPEWLIQSFRDKNRPFMKYTNIIQFNTRVIFLFFCLFIDQVWLFFLFDMIVLNAFLIYLIANEEKVSKAVLNEIKLRESQPVAQHA